MGNLPSTTAGPRWGVEYSSNDYQLAIELSKELEFVLEHELGAQGKGLHEKTTSVEHKLPLPTVRALRFIASVRNSLIHDRDVRALRDRAGFIKRFEAAREELQVLIDRKRAASQPPAAQGPECVVQ